MRLLVFVFFLTLTLMAKDKESCYTVQLFSLYNSSENKSILNNKKLPNMCKVMEIGKGLTVRCGCFDRIDDAKELLPKINSNYKDSYIASTYKYRFEDDKVVNTKEINVNNSLKDEKQEIKEENKIEEKKKVMERILQTKTKKRKKVSQKAVEVKKTVARTKMQMKEDELKTIVQTFMYNNELDYAYKAAKIGYRNNPNSYYWNQKMAEISRWSGRSDEAMKYMLFMYSKKKNRKLEKELITYAIDAYQYDTVKDLVLNQLRNNPTDKHVDELIFVYDRIGIPEESADYLMQEYSKDSTKYMYLGRALEIYINLGNLDKAQSVVNIMNRNNNAYTVREVELISYFYLLRKDMKSAYDILLVIPKEEQDYKFLVLLSDLGWYLQEYDNASMASLTIINKYDARLEDYERVIQANKDKDNDLALNMSLEVYEKFKASYLFYAYSVYAIRDKKYDQLQVIVDQIDAGDSEMKNDADYWVIKSTLYTHSGDGRLAKLALEKALKIKPDSLEIQLTAITMYIKSNTIDRLKVLLKKLEENPLITGSLNYVLASSYLYIYDINKASYYIDKLVQSGDSVTKSIDFQFFLADLYSIRNNENGFMMKMYEIKSALEKEAIQDPELLRDNVYLNNYLKVALHTMHVDDFTDELDMSKPYLSQFNYNNLSYAFASMIQSTELAHTIFQKIRRKEPWLLLANASQQQEHASREDLLERYLELLPLGDASQAANNDGQVSLSQTIAYKALSLNDDNQNAYIQHLALSRERSDRVSAKIGTLSEGAVTKKYVDIDNSAYLNENWYLLSNARYSLNSLSPNLVIQNIPEDTLNINMGIKKVFRRGYLEGNIGHVSSLDSNMNASVEGSYRIAKHATVSSKIAKNMNTQETEELSLGGKKDMLSTGLLWNIMPSASLEFLYERNRYTGQDDTLVGNGEYFKALLNYDIKKGYPDMRVSVFYDKGSYAEAVGSRGIIDSLQIQRNPMLPNNFYNIGLGFTYGIVNSQLYTRVWRPFFDVSGYYNSDLGKFNYSVDAGYGGKIFSQDHLSVGMSYSEALYGNGARVFELFLRYQFFYIRPGIF